MCSDTFDSHYRIQQSQGSSEQTQRLVWTTHTAVTTERVTSAFIYLMETDMQSTASTLTEHYIAVNVMERYFKNHTAHFIVKLLSWQEAMEKAFRPTAGRENLQTRSLMVNMGLKTALFASSL